MCGFAGLFIPRSVAAFVANLEGMLGTLAHRGPDGSGDYVSPDRRFQAGFNRLAIIDLQTSDQPIIEPAPDGGVLLGNGEIYNYLELRHSLPAYPYRTSGDMETVLAARQGLGAAYLDALNGMFALALYDRGRHRLELVRDRLGIKPLYWAMTPAGAVLFASEPKAILASGLIAAEIEDAAVTDFLVHGYNPGSDTIYRGIRKLAPGHRLIVDADGAVTVERWWQAKAATGVPSSPVEARACLRDLLADSVRLQLRSDVPVAALLSGGIDSGLIVALAAGQSSNPLNTYTVSFEGAPVDEAPLAALVAQRYGTRHTRLELPRGKAMDLLPRLAWFADEPLADAALLPNYMVDALLSREIRVVLNGTGGDELFGGYGRYFQTAIEAKYLRLPAPLRTAIEALIGVVDPMNAWRLGRAAQRDADRGGYLNAHTTQFPPPMLRLIGHRRGSGPVAQSRHFADFTGPPDTGQLYADLMTYVPEDLLALLDRTTMAVAVEGRVPFLDHRMVEASLALAPDIRTPGGRQKGLLRDLARDLLPAEILSAPKQGFASPVPAWFTGEMLAATRRRLTRRDCLERGWWSKAGIERLLAAPATHAFRLYQLLMLDLSVEMHVVRGQRVPPDMTLTDLADA